MVLFRTFDILIVLMLIAVAVGTSFLLDSSAGSAAEIYVSNQKVAYFRLDGAVRYKAIRHKIGKSVIKYGDGFIQVISSPCPQQICVLRGAINQTYENII